MMRVAFLLVSRLFFEWWLSADLTDGASSEIGLHTPLLQQRVYLSIKLDRITLLQLVQVINLCFPALLLEVLPINKIF
jgi:hypothetical protein